MFRRVSWRCWRRWVGSGEVPLGRINRANLKKTIYYLKRNGLKKTWYAVRERMEKKRQPPYVWSPPSEAELSSQRRQWEEEGFSVVFSILVPVYRTKPEYLAELIASLRGQTYPKWELILADATEDDSVERVVRRILDFGKPEAGREDSFGIGSRGSGGRKSDAVSGSSGWEYGISEERDSRIRYIHLDQNSGIAENTNRALLYAAGDYVGLLDHDDVLTENALFEMAAAIEAGRQRGCVPRMLYSDEDKCNGDRTKYYEPNFKEAFNLDLLLSNNYICHFLVMDRELMQKLRLRHEYDGAQDYDLVLRAAAELGAARADAAPPDARRKGAVKPGAVRADAAEPGSIIHIPKVLYHWRCHTGSTAENPESKRYAYDAGRMAVQDFANQAGWHAKAVNTPHVGFYLLEYEGSIFDSRPEVGAVGGSVIGRRRLKGSRLAAGEPEAGSGMKRDGSEAGSGMKGNASEAGSGMERNEPEAGDRAKGNMSETSCGPKRSAFTARGRPGYGTRIIGGRMAEDGSIFYENLPVHYSGYLHRAILPQDAFAVDIRNIRVRPECRELFRKVTGVPYQALPGTDIFDVSVLPEGCDIRKVSLAFGRAMREAGYRIIYTARRIDLQPCDMT